MASVSANARGTQTIYECEQCRLRFADTSALSSDRILSILRTADVKEYLTQEHYRTKTYERSLRNFSRFIGPPGRAFDIGAGSGAFLSALQQHGWEVAGCEINEALCTAARTKGVFLRNEPLTALSLPAGSLDLVTFWDSLEHTLDPSAQLKIAATALRPGGRLIINYPNVETWFSRILGDRWWYCIPMHFFYFSFANLRAKLSTLGLQATHHVRHWQSLELGHVLSQVGIKNVPSKWPLRYYAGQWTLVAVKESV